MRVRTCMTRAKMPNLGAAMWRTILTIKLLCFPRCVPELLLSHIPKFIEMLTMHSNVTIKNVSWPHFSWATLYSHTSIQQHQHHLQLSANIPSFTYSSLPKKRQAHRFVWARSTPPSKPIHINI